MNQDAILDALMSHAVDLAGYTNGVVRRIAAMLARSEAAIAAELALKLDTGTVFQLARLDSLLSGVYSMNTAAYADLGRELSARMFDLFDQEVLVESALLGARAPVESRMRSVATQQAFAAATAEPFKGRLMSEWVESLSARRAQRVRDAVAEGFATGRSVSETVRALRGTRAAKYQDGLLAIDRRSAEAIVRTATAHFAAEARNEVYRKNADLIEEVQWVSTLDSRTSEWCQIRDGKRYSNDSEHRPIGHDVPWLGGPGNIHWNCRSTSMPVLKIASQLGLDQGRERASKDGPVSAKLTFADWIKRQPADVQNEVLGKTRATLMRAGKYTLDRFYDNKGRYFTIDELRKRDRRTFERLGI